ncbi:hypothetical protein [Nibribacter koreensis]|uniref:Lipoprotein n=1 Tax=Nibribacter koreensis TaxID=1084519 RepID=A0ABP8FYE9_9BACT
MIKEALPDLVGLLSFLAYFGGKKLKVNNMRTEFLHLKIFSRALLIGVILCCSSCLVSTHLFIPVDANNKFGDEIQGSGYILECHAPYNSDAILEAVIKQSMDSLSKFKLSKISINWIENGDTISVNPEKQGHYSSYSYFIFSAPNIKKRKTINVSLEGILVKGNDSVVILQSHTLKKVRDYFFTIH